MTNAKLLRPYFEGDQNLGKIGIGVARYRMLPFHTLTVVKIILRIVGLSLFQF